MEKKVKLSANQIINKEFSASVKGYQALEVDEFLDLIVEDYVNFEKDYNSLVQQHKTLDTNYEALKRQFSELEAKYAILSAKVQNIGDNTQVSRANIDLLNRIKALENALFKYGEDPTKIK